MVLAKLEADLFAVLGLHVEEDLPICAAGAAGAKAALDGQNTIARVCKDG
jgi:hypothetical protein